MVKLNNKGQSLPLNTIVIALLVVIVLVVIVLAFTSNVGQTNDTLQESNQCNADNAAINIIYSPERYTIGPESGTTCPEGSSRIPGVPTPDDEVCCATPIEGGGEEEEE